MGYKTGFTVVVVFLYTSGFTFTLNINLKLTKRAMLSVFGHVVFSEVCWSTMQMDDT